MYILIVKFTRDTDNMSGNGSESELWENTWGKKSFSDAHM